MSDIKKKKVLDLDHNRWNLTFVETCCENFLICNWVNGSILCYISIQDLHCCILYLFWYVKCNVLS